MIIHGERRWRAAEIAGLEIIPAIVREDQESGERLVDQLMENLQREDLNAMDRAEGFARLKEAMGSVAGSGSRTRSASSGHASTSCSISSTRT